MKMMYFIIFYSKKIVIKVIFEDRIDIRNDFLYQIWREYSLYGSITSRQGSVGESVKQVEHEIGTVLGSVWIVEKIWHACCYPLGTMHWHSHSCSG